MNGKQLKNSILQWAIQGKLVPQDPNDEPASVLLERIRAEKARLVKEGKIKKDKNESIIYKGDDNSYYEKFPDGKVVCIDEEIPFEIPEGWEWCRLGQIAGIIGGYAFPSQTIKGDVGTRVIRISDITDMGFSDTRLVRYNGGPIPDIYQIHKFDILIAMTGGTVGKSLFVKELPEKMLLNQRVAIIRNRHLFADYLNLVIKAPHVIAVINDRKNSTNDNISMVDIYNFLIPIPPLSEQNNIVAKYQEVLPLIERYATAQYNADVLNTCLSEKLNKSILQEAIQGRLIPQDPYDEPASALLEKIWNEKQQLVKDGKLKAKDNIRSIIFRGDDNKYYEKTGKDVVDITEEIPFEIPENWEWSRLKNIVFFNPKNVASDETVAAFMPMNYINPGYGSGYKFDEVQWGKIKKGFSHFAKGDIAFAKITPCFQNRKSFIANNLPSNIGAGTTELIVLRPYGNTLCREYVLFFLQSSYFVEEAKFKGTAGQQRIMAGYTENKLFPIPPYEEQIRISKKINELLASIMSR